MQSYMIKKLVILNNVIHDADSRLKNTRAIEHNSEKRDVITNYAGQLTRNQKWEQNPTMIIISN